MFLSLPALAVKFDVSLSNGREDQIYSKRKGPEKFAGPFEMLGETLCEDLKHRFIDGVLGHIAHDLLGYLAALEDEQRGNSTNAIACRR